MIWEYHYFCVSVTTIEANENEVKFMDSFMFYFLIIYNGKFSGSATHPISTAIDAKHNEYDL